MLYAVKGDYAYNLETGVAIEVQGRTIMFSGSDRIRRNIPFENENQARKAFDKMLAAMGDRKINLNNLEDDEDNFVHGGEI